MDAPTTTSADGGSSGGSGGDWGWFTPSEKKSPAEQAEGQRRYDVQGGGQERDGGSEPDDRGGPDDRAEHGVAGERNERYEPYGRSRRNEERDCADRAEWHARERIPSRPVNPIRPVGTAAERGREVELPQPPQQPRNPQQTQGPERARPLQQARDRRLLSPPSWERRPARNREPEPLHEAAHAPVAPADAAAAAPTGSTPTGSFPTDPTPPEPSPRAAAPAPSLQALEASAAASATPASPDAILIRRTMAEIEPVADKVTSYFYALLFVQHPDLRALFPAAMDAQRDRLFKALLTAARHVDDADVLTAYLANLGRGHRKYGTLPDHYPAVGECLLTALGRYAPSSWSPEAEAAWVRAYTAISQIMIDAAAENEAVAPAWWQAEVVSHELRTSDIAVVTVRPDQPYPFLAGQYTSIETPWWPRVWRHYSFASAPRADGLLSFHVKAVPAGWVSNAMVHRARPGDVIRLGAPAGSMTVDHSTHSGLLCVGGGTGIAPIKALVEDVAEHGIRRPVEVFYGARSGHDLYDLDTMLHLERSHPWLSVRPVVATGATGRVARGGISVETGQLPDAVRLYGPFSEYDAYLSGPPGLIRSGVDALVGVGIPTDRIRHDSVEELVSAGE
ncbi:globin domain-containing protein [Streptomyces sp. NPDC001339]|uniref:globin domain-containing protein n=1 Tax=Streptomyces sp. NPDC001339 TaxID=3364563 RepID=UPI0036CBD1F8